MVCVLACMRVRKPLATVHYSVTWAVLRQWQRGTSAQQLSSITKPCRESYIHNGLGRTLFILSLWWPITRRGITHCTVSYSLRDRSRGWAAVRDGPSKMGQIGLNRSRLVSKPRLITRSTDTSMTTTTTANGAFIYLAGLGFEKKTLNNMLARRSLSPYLANLQPHHQTVVLSLAAPAPVPLERKADGPCVCEQPTQ